MSCSWLLSCSRIYEKMNFCLKNFDNRQSELGIECMNRKLSNSWNSSKREVDPWITQSRKDSRRWPGFNPITFTFSENSNYCTIWTLVHNQTNQKIANFQHSPLITSKMVSIYTFEWKKYISKRTTLDMSRIFSYK